MGEKIARAVRLRKAATGIAGFDEITRGGLQRGQITLVTGGPGCGKTVFALQTLAAGAREGEAAIFVAFEESPAQIVSATRGFDWQLSGMSRDQLDLVDAQLSSAVLQGGEFDLMGLLAIVGARAKAMSAKRVAFDGIDVLLGHLADGALIRREMVRLREWSYAEGLTTLVTAKAAGSVDFDFLQYLADAVVSLRHQVHSGSAIRLLRVEKYRGGAHSSNEFPFTLTRGGLEMSTGTSPMLEHSVSTERVTSGITRLDAMLGGGYYRGSSVLISGAPGTAKSSLGAAFAEAACRKGEATLFVSFDESPEQIVRNVASIGISLAPHVAAKRLAMCSLRARADNAESHVARIRALLAQHRARHLVIDPISAIARSTDDLLADRAAVQLLDVAKSLGVTTLSTSLLSNSAPLSEETPIGISTIADTWMHLSYVNQGGERNRALTIVKSRGTRHSSQVRELVLSDAGITLADPYTAGGEVLMGTLRWEKEIEARRSQQTAVRDAELKRRQVELALAEARVKLEALRTEEALREAELRRLDMSDMTSVEVAEDERLELARRRGADPVIPAAKAKRKRKVRR